MSSLVVRAPSKVFIGGRDITEWVESIGIHFAEVEREAGGHKMIERGRDTEVSVTVARRLISTILTPGQVVEASFLGTEAHRYVVSAVTDTHVVMQRTGLPLT